MAAPAGLLAPHMHALVGIPGLRRQPAQTRFEMLLRRCRQPAFQRFHTLRVIACLAVQTQDVAREAIADRLRTLARLIDNALVALDRRQIDTHGKPERLWRMFFGE